MDLSIVIPVFNEEDSIATLISEIDKLSNIQFEIIVVDDCSSDNTQSELINLKQKYSNLRVISHRENYGQSSAIATGVKNSISNVIATLDGDGQNDPKDIPKLFEIYKNKSINEKGLMVAGHRVVRKDNFLKRISSKYANMLRSKVLGDGVPDTGCGLKIFSKNDFLNLPFFDHMHRYLPALHQSRGGDVISFPVNHRVRKKGFSKYGFHNRFWVGLLDLLGVRWLKRRSKVISYKEN